MKRRDFIRHAAMPAALSAASVTLPPPAWAGEKSRLEITGIRAGRGLHPEVLGEVPA